MSTLWANIKKRRGSSHANLTTAESSKTQSGRSSHNVSREEHSFRSDQSCMGDTSQEEEPSTSEEGWSKISKFAGQVLPRNIKLPQVRLRPEFYKGLKSATLPRHFRTKSKDAPTPANTPEPGQFLSKKAPFLDSSKQALKVLQKRAASVSPSRIRGETSKQEEETSRAEEDSSNEERRSRIEGGKQKSFRRSFQESLRGISAERLPKPIRNFIRSHKAKSLPPERVPPKPSRRPGPVGKTWIKVYDDITFMDDPSAGELQPMLGYTGHPTKIPDAQPLPEAPTPPPKRALQEVKAVSASTASVESEYDNVPPARRKTPEPETLEPTQSEPETLEHSQPEPEENELLEATKMVIHTTHETPIDDNKRQIPFAPTAATRTGRSREVSRYKGKRQKRISTPIGRPTTSDSDADIPEIELETRPERTNDDYKVHQVVVKPDKPKRGTKVRDAVSVEKELKVTETEEDQHKNIDISEPKGEAQPKEEPYRPKRGIKIYESIIIVQEEKKKLKEKSENNETSDKEQKPPKPRRGMKIYETIKIIANEPTLDEKASSGKQTHTQDVEGENKISEIAISEDKSEGTMNRSKDTTMQTCEDALKAVEDSLKTSEVSLPPRPSRGSKIYETVKGREPQKEKDVKACHDQIEKEKVVEEINGFENSDNKEDNKTDLESPTPIVPLYARVHKNRGSQELTEKVMITDSIPPPIPPKKRASRNAKPQEPIYDLLPPRPQRHLKPKSRSLDPSPNRIISLKTSTLPNGDYSYNSENQNSSDNDFSVDDYGKKPAKPKRHTKVVKIEEVSKMMEVNGKRQKAPTKPARYTHGRLPAPPRRKKVEKTSYGSKQDDENKSNKDIYENVDIKDGKTTLKILTVEENEPAAPPLPRKHKKNREERLADTSMEIKEAINLSNENDSSDEHKQVHLTLSSHNSTNDSSEDSKVEENRELYKSIDNNLKNIECSFETLDEVLKSLRNYSRASPSRILLSEHVSTNTDEISKDLSTNSSSKEVISNKEQETDIPDETYNKNLDDSLDCDACSDISVSDEDTIISVEKIEVTTLSDSTLDIDVPKNSEEVLFTPIKYKLSCDGDKIIIKENVVQSVESRNSESASFENENLDESERIKKPSIYATQMATYEFKPEEEEISASTTDTLYLDSQSLPENTNLVGGINSSLEASSEEILENDPDADSVLVCKIPLKLISVNPNTSMLSKINTQNENEVHKEKSAFEEKEDIISFKFEPETSKLKLDSRDHDSIELTTVVTEIPLKITTPEVTTFKFEPENYSILDSIVSDIPAKFSTSESTIGNLIHKNGVQGNKEATVITEIPVKLVSPEITYFKFDPDNVYEYNTVSESVPIEIPLKLSTSLATTYKFKPETVEAASVVTEISVKLISPEITTFKFDPESADEEKTVTEKVITEIPLKLSTSETTTFKFAPESVEAASDVTEIPVKLVNQEISTFKFDPESTDQTKTVSESVITEIPLKLTISETSTFKFKPEPVEAASVVTEIPVQLVSPEITTFKFDPETTDQNKLVSEAVITEIPLKLITSETTNFKFEPESVEAASVVTEIPVQLVSPEITTFKLDTEPTDQNKPVSEAVITEIPLKLTTSETTTFKFEPESVEAASVVTEIPVQLVSPEITTFKFVPETTDKNKTVSESVITEIPLKLTTSETTTFKFEPEAVSVVTEIPVKLVSPEITTFKFNPETADQNKTVSDSVITEIPLKLTTSETTTFKCEPESVEAASVVTEIPVKLISPEITTFKFDPESADEEKTVTEPVITEIPLKLSTSETTTFKFEPESVETASIVTENPVKLVSQEIATFKFDPEIADENKSVSESVITETPLKLTTSETTTFKFEPESVEAASVVTEIPVKLVSQEITTFKFDPETADENKSVSESVITEIPLKLTTSETTTFKFEPESVEAASVVTEIPVKLINPEITTFKFDPESADEEKTVTEPVITEIPLKLSTSETTTFKFEPESVEAASVVTEIPVKLVSPEIATFKFDPETAEENKQVSESVTTEIPLKLTTSETTTFKFEPESVEAASVITEVPVKLVSPEITTLKFDPETADENKTVSESVITEIPLILTTTETTEFTFEPETIEAVSVVTEIPVKLVSPEITTFKFDPETAEQNKPVSESVITEIPLKLTTSETTTFKFEPESVEAASIVTEIPVKLVSPEITTFKFDPETADENKTVSESVITEIPLKLTTSETATFKFEPESAEAASVVTEIPVNLVSPEITTLKFDPETADQNKPVSESVITEIPLKLTTSETTTFKFEPESVEAALVVTEIPVKLVSPEITTFKFDPETADQNEPVSESVITEIPLKLTTSETTTFKFEPESVEAASIVTEIPVKLVSSEITTFKFDPETADQNKTASESVITEIPLKLTTSETATFKFEPVSAEAASVVTEIPVNLVSPEITTFKFDPETADQNKPVSESVITEIPLKLKSETTTFKFEPETVEAVSVVTEIPVKLASPDITTFKYDPATADQNKTLSDSVITEIPLKLTTTETTTFKFEPESVEAASVVTEIPVKLVSPEITTFKFDLEKADENKTVSEAVLTEIPLKLTTTETTTFKFEPESVEVASVVTEIPVKLLSPEITTFKFDPETAAPNKTVSESVITEIPLKLTTSETTTYKFEPEIIVISEIPVRLVSPEITTFKFAPQTIIDDIIAESAITDIPLKSPTSESMSNKFKACEPDPVETVANMTKISAKLVLPEIATNKREPDTITNKNPVVESTSTEIPMKVLTSETATVKFETEISPHENRGSVEIDPLNIHQENIISGIVTEKFPEEHSGLEISHPIFDDISNPPSKIGTEIPVKLTSPEIATFKFEAEPCHDSKIVDHSVVTEIPIKFATPLTATFKFEPDSSAINLSESPTPLPVSSITESKVPSISGPQKVSEAELQEQEIMHNQSSVISGSTTRDIADQENISGAAPESSVSELATRLEGLRSQLEAVITNYPTTPSSSISSIDTTLSDVGSNRSSLLFTAPESPLSFYSPSQSRLSMCSTPCTYYTAASDQSDSSLILSDSDRTNTPSPTSSISSSIKADDERQTSSEEEPGEL